MTLEHTILNNLITNEQFNRRVIPYIEVDYLTSEETQLIFSAIHSFINKYNKPPTKESLLIEIESLEINEKLHQNVVEIVDGFSKEKEDTDWLIDKTEEFCQDRAVYNSIMSSIAIINGQDKNRTRSAIPALLESALAVSFDANVGHDYIDNVEHRYEFYVAPEFKIPFDIELLNKITRGGFSQKTLNIFVAGTGVGKSLAMCHMAAANLMDGKNVLYITMEMAEERIAERIDANLMDVNINDLSMMPKDDFLRIFEKKVSKRTTGRLEIKEYPTGAAHVGHFRHLINELRLKKNFKPDIIYVDYINICASSRVKPAIGSYTYIKFIAEELRGFAVENNAPLISATQLNRGGIDSSDVSLSETSESIGLPFTADFMCAIVQTEDMRPRNQFLFKQWKNRYNDFNYYNKFMVGVDKPKMRLYDLEDDAQQDISEPGIRDDDSPIFDKGRITERFNKEKIKGLIT